MAETKARFIAGNFTTAGKPSDVTGATGSSQGMAVYSTVDNLPTTNLTSGDQAYVSSSNRLYISNGSGWYNVALINASPSLTISPSGTVTLAIDGSTPTVITLTGADSDTANQNLTYSVESDGSFANIATLSQDSSVFTVTPLSEAASTPGTSTLTFKVSDGIAFGSGTTQFSLTFGPDWTQSPTQTAIRPSDGGADDYFGYSAKISKNGEYAIVGANQEDYDAGNTRPNAGAAYIFVKSGGSWSQQAKLQASDALSADGFGIDVAISEDGTYAIVGANYGGTGSGNDNHGSVYVFIRSGTTWTQQQEINAGDAQEGAQFGQSIDINADGSYIAIGTPYWNSSNYGAVYVWTRSGTTWSQQQRIQQSSPGANDQFGFTTRISDNGDYIMATAPYKYSTDRGMCFVWIRSGTTWTEQASFQSTDIENEDRLGFGGDISGDGQYVIVGSSWEDGGSGNPIDRAGAAYIFLRTGTSWAQQAKLVASDAGQTDSFGYRCSISTDGSFAVVGAGLEDGGAGDPKQFHGAAYVYTRDGTTWTQARKLDAGGLLDVRDYLGETVDISGDGSVVIATARGDDDNGTDAGASYFFEA